MDSLTPSPVMKIYNKMRTQNDIRYQIKKIEKPADKVFVLVQVCSPTSHLSSTLHDFVHSTQAVLACINLSDPEYKGGESNPVMEAFSVFRHITRIMKG